MLNLRDRSFSKYDAMTDEELQEILRADASSNSEESDTELILYVMEVLARRRKERNEEINTAQAWESFRENYMPAEKKPQRLRAWQKGLVAAAAVLVIVFGTAATASALKFDLWSIIAEWTENTFHFGTPAVTAPSAPENNYACAGLQAAVDEYKASAKLVPQWLPDGYLEDDIRVIQTPKQRRIRASYLSGEKTMIIQINEYIGSLPTQIEQSDSLLEVYNSNNIDYYIFTDNNRLQAAWITDCYECAISGELTIEELKIIINSIG